MNRTNIEWTNYTWNPITGCTRGCEYCYARKMAQRLKGRYGYPENEPFRPTFHPDRLKEPYAIKKPSKIFTCSMGEIFDYRVHREWVRDIIAEMQAATQHIFQVLTKNAPNAEYLLCDETLPKNLWLGSSQDGKYTDLLQLDNIAIINPKVKFVSFEPLLGPIEGFLGDLDWIIIGAQTNPYKPPKPEWVQDIIDQAREFDIPVFLKNNLQWPEKIQEFPNGRAEG